MSMPGVLLLRAAAAFSFSEALLAIALGSNFPAYGAGEPGDAVSANSAGDPGVALGEPLAFTSI